MGGLQPPEGGNCIAYAWVEFAGSAKHAYLNIGQVGKTFRGDFIALATPQPSAGTSLEHGSAGEPLPVPKGETLIAVLDPSVEMPGISGDEAIALARAIVSDKVGKAPRVQLVRLALSDPSSDFGREWTGWIILSTDIRGNPGGPYNPDAPPPSVFATYTWVHVTLDGEVIGVSQDVYDGPEFVPPLPSSMAYPSGCGIGYFADYLGPLGETPETALDAFVELARSRQPADARAEAERESIVAAGLLIEQDGPPWRYSARDAEGVLAVYRLEPFEDRGYVVSQYWVRLPEEFCDTDPPR